MLVRQRFLEALLFPPTSLHSQALASSLEGKTVLITGASSGIGEQLAYLLADYKVHLILVARREDKLKAVKETVEKGAGSAQVSLFPADLRNEEAISGLVQFLHQLPQGLDLVVSNAGHSIHRSIYQSLDRYHDFARTMAINYAAPVQLLLGVIPLLEQSQGHIIQVSTINVLLHPFPEWAAYQASKSAFDSWFLSVAPELNAVGIATSSVYLPLVRTPMMAPTAAYQSLPAMTSSQAARVIGKLIVTRRRTFKPWWVIFGQLGSVLFRGWLEQLLPRQFRKRKRRS